MSSAPRSRLVVLEGLRGLAASYVVLHHISPFRGTALEWLTRFGQEAVTVFFLLSGFVIHYACAQEQALAARTYFIKRFRRIYPPLLFAFGVSALVQVLRVGPDADLKPRELVLNLLMLQDLGAIRPGALAEPYLGNGPLWSLSYEWWFYMLYFPIVRGVPRDRWLGVVALIAALGVVVFVWAPSFAARVMVLFAVWWLGVEMARAYLAHGRVRFEPMMASLAVMGAVTTALVANALWLGRTLSTTAGRYPWVEPRIVGVGLVLAVIGMLHHRVEFRGARSLLTTFARVSPISYGLYILHTPILELRHLDQFPRGLLGTLLALALIVALSYLVEVRVQPLVNRHLR